jgi:predicted ATPase
MHLKGITLFPEKYPAGECYPFNLKIFHLTRRVIFHAPVTFLVGENGTGKSTFLKAIAHKSGIHIWRDIERSRYETNPLEEDLHRFISLQWTGGPVSGSFFAGEIFRDFAQNLDEWAIADPGILKYFGGRSLTAQSHGQSLMSFFKARYQVKGLYLLDEPETALSPKSQLELLRVLRDTGRSDRAQFIIATHSPILLACPGARIYSFDHSPVKQIDYEETEHYQIYKEFMVNRSGYLDGSQ